MTSDAISRDPTIVVIDLPKRSHFETLQANWSPGLFETPAGGSFRAKIGFRNKSNCNALTNSDYSKVIGKQAAMYTLILCLILSHSNNWIRCVCSFIFCELIGKFPDGTYVWYWGYSELDNNTPDSPTPLGGLNKKNNGLEYCSNVPKNFLNSKFDFQSLEYQTQFIRRKKVFKHFFLFNRPQLKRAQSPNKKHVLVVHITSGHLRHNLKTLLSVVHQMKLQTIKIFQHQRQMHTNLMEVSKAFGFIYFATSWNWKSS